MRVYLAGPMTGIPQYNFPAFEAAARTLRDYGYDVVSPAELDDPADRARALASPDGAPQTIEGFGKSWGDFLARDVKLLADGGFDGVVVLRGWSKSKGARLETFVAHLMGLPIYHYDHIESEQNRRVPALVLYKTWSGEPSLSIHSSFGSSVFERGAR